MQVLAPEYLKVPNTESEWDAVANKFETRWKFPNGIGAIDGKLVIVQQPSNSGSHYYDYKGNYSIVLLVVFGPDYQCLWASAGTNGRLPDSAIWQNCDLKKALSSCHNSLDLPKVVLYQLLCLVLRPLTFFFCLKPTKNVFFHII